MKKRGKTIQGGDFIRIKCPALNSYLTSSLCYQENTPEVYYRKYMGDFQEEHLTPNTIWEIYHKKRIYQGKPFTNDQT